jgi:hypothetical protein
MSGIMGVSGLYRLRGVVQSGREAGIPTGRHEADEGHEFFFSFLFMSFIPFLFSCWNLSDGGFS